MKYISKFTGKQIDTAIEKTNEIDNLEVIVNTNTAAIETLNGTGEGSVEKIVTDKVAEIVAGAPEEFDTLKEMSDWLTNHEESAAAMNTAIQQNTTDIATNVSAIQKNTNDIASNTTAISELQSNIVNKADNNIFIAENLIPFPFYFTDGYTYRGITYNSTADGGVTITGTPTNTTYARLNKENLIMLEHKKYILSGCPDGGSDTTYCVGVTKGSTSVTAVIKDYGNGAIIDNTDGSFDEGINITVAVYSGTYDNFEFKPMLEVGSVAHEYQPYKLSRKAIRDDIDALKALLT